MKIKSVTTNPTEVAPPGREKQVRALKGKVDNPYAVAWSSYNKSKGKKEAIGDELADEGGFKDIDTANKEKARLYALLKQKKELYNAAMAGQGGGVGREEELEDEIEEIQKSLGIGEAEQPELPGMTPQTKELNINGMTTEEDVISMIQDTISAGKGDDAKDYLEQLKQYLFVKSGGQAESKELNTEAMKKEDKKPVNESKQPVKEAITMTADSPQEAGMLMQILKLAGVQQVTPDMVGAEAPADNDADHDHNGDGQQDHAPQDCPSDDAIGSGEMGKMRDVVTAPDEEQAEETWDNTPDEKVDDVDTLVNVHSGGLNKQKQQVRKEYPGDNPLAAEDKISEEDLANSLRTQYEGFKKSYQEAAKVAEEKGKDHDKDGDVDSKDYLKSKDIAIKKAIKK